MSVILTQIDHPAEKSAICDGILRRLPNWFGIEASIVDYVRQVADLPFWAARDGALALGFAALLPHTAHAAEICVMGLVESAHRRGIGRALVAECEQWCRRQGVEYLTVKTLSEGNPDPYYARTRQFYSAVGFVPLEVFPTLWDPVNPCLMMVKPVL